VVFVGGGCSGVVVVVVLIVACKGKSDLGAQSGVGADVVGEDFTVVTEFWGVTCEGMNDGLFTQNGGVVDEKK